MAAVTLIDVAGSTSSTQSSSSFTSSPAVRFDLISLPDPSSCSGDNNDNNDDGTPLKSSSLSTMLRDYILVSNKSSIDIHEVQIIKANNGKYASYFIGSRIISNPNLHISTRIDPLFFVFAHFHRQAINNGSSSSNRQWLPWEQALADISPHVLQALNVDLSSSSLDIDDACGQLKHLLEVSDYGDDLLLCRFDNDKALHWLVQKFNKAKGAMCQRLIEKKKRNVTSIKRNTESGAFTSSFTVEEEEKEEVGPSVNVDEDCKGDETGNVGEKEVADWSILTKEEEVSISVGALQLICEYLSTEWRVTLSKEVGLTKAQWMGKKCRKSNTSSITNKEEKEKEECTGEKRSRSAWEGSIGQEDADALLQYTQGIGAGKAASVTPGEMKKKELYKAQSVGLKKLAKVNTKGMKSLSSFFGAGTKKVKK